jgi:3-deoxy-manno-octulosonate cytidylyltransferase (CMP-KDO synthetase)
MIEHVYRRAAKSRGVAAVIVATDDERIVLAVERFGGEARLTRADHPTGSDRVAEVARGLACDIVVNVQGDEPFIEPLMIEQALAPLIVDLGVSMSTLRRRITDPGDLQDPNVVKVVVDRAGDALYFSRLPVPFVRDRAVPGSTRVPVAFRHVGLYVYRRQFLLELTALEQTPLERSEALEQLRVLEHGYRIRTVETLFDTLSVDTSDDLERARRLAAGLAFP